MNQPVLLKGNSLGLTMVLDPGMKFDQLIKAIEDKFVQAKDFFNGQTQIALKIEGRKLDAKELQNVLQIIAEKTTLTIAYVIEDDKIMETSFKDVLKKIQEREQKRSQSMVDERRKGDGQFYRGTLRSGQVLESVSSVVIVGDVNPGAKIISQGNIIVLGALKGNAYAGAAGDSNCFIVALEMDPIQIQIGDILAKSPDKKMKPMRRLRRKEKNPVIPEAQIAVAKGGNIYIEPITRASLNDYTK